VGSGLSPQIPEGEAILNERERERERKRERERERKVGLRAPPYFLNFHFLAYFLSQ
jgi:hypothetical protein